MKEINDHYGDCFYCQNNESSYCEECEHCEHNYYDHWVAVESQEIAKKEKASLEKAIKNTIEEYVELDISTELKKTFDTAKKYAIKQDEFRPVLMGVLMTKDGYMVASDTYILCKIKCDSIPECLQGHIVITLGDGKAGINHGTFPAYETILNITDHKSQPFSQITKKYKNKELCQEHNSNETFLQIDDSIVALDSVKLQQVEDILQGEITVFYKPGEIFEPLIFEGSNGVMIILP